MTLGELKPLLKVIAAYDGRNLGQADILVWGRQMADVEAVDAVEAVHEHYGATKDWIYPSDVRRLAERHRNRRNKRPEVVAPGCYEPDEDARRRLMPSTDGLRALPTGEGAKDRFGEVREGVVRLANGWTERGDTVFRRREVVEWERAEQRRQRAAVEGPNPYYDPDMGQPVGEWQRNGAGPAGAWWLNEVKREEHAARLLDDAGRLRRNREDEAA